MVLPEHWGMWLCFSVSQGLQQTGWGADSNGSVWFCVSARAQHAVQHPAAEHALLLHVYLTHLLHLHLRLSHDVISWAGQSQCTMGVGTSMDLGEIPPSVMREFHDVSSPHDLRPSCVQFGKVETL